MSRKDKAAINDEAWLRAAWDWAVELSNDRDAAVYVVLTPTERPGVWKAKIKAVLVKDDKVVDTFASTEAHFPNDRVTTFTALLFTLAGDLSIEMEKRYGPTF